MTRLGFCTDLCDKIGIRHRHANLHEDFINEKRIAETLVATLQSRRIPGSKLVTPQAIDGNPLPRTPEWLFNFILQYTVPLANGSVYFNTDWNYRDESNIFLHRSVEFVAEERWLGGLRIGYKNEAENIDVAIVGRNITDEIVVDGALNFLNLTAFINEPAFWGLELKYSF